MPLRRSPDRHSGGRSGDRRLVVVSRETYDIGDISNKLLS